MVTRLYIAAIDVRHIGRSAFFVHCLILRVLSLLALNVVVN